MMSNPSSHEVSRGLLGTTSFSVKGVVGRIGLQLDLRLRVHDGLVGPASGRAQRAAARMRGSCVTSADMAAGMSSSAYPTGS